MSDGGGSAGGEARTIDAKSKVHEFPCSQRSSPHFTCSCIRFSYALPFTEQDSLTQHQTRAMADNGSNNRDGKRKWDNGGGRGRGRGGNMQHGSRPNKKRNMGRKEHA